MQKLTRDGDWWDNSCADDSSTRGKGRRDAAFCRSRSRSRSAVGFGTHKHIREEAPIAHLSLVIHQAFCTFGDSLTMILFLKILLHSSLFNHVQWLRTCHCVVCVTSMPLFCSQDKYKRKKKDSQSVNNASNPSTDVGVIRIGHYILNETLGTGSFGKVKSRCLTVRWPVRKSEVDRSLQRPTIN